MVCVNPNPCFRAVGYSIMLCVLLALAEIKKRENPTPRPKPKSPNHPPHQSARYQLLITPCTKARTNGLWPRGAKKPKSPSAPNCAGYQLLITLRTKARTNGLRPRAWHKSPNHPPRPLRGVSTSNNPPHQSADKQSAAAWGVNPNSSPHQIADKRPAAARIEKGRR